MKTNETNKTASAAKIADTATQINELELEAEVIGNDLGYFLVGDEENEYEEDIYPATIRGDRVFVGDMEFRIVPGSTQLESI